MAAGGGMEDFWRWVTEGLLAVIGYFSGRWFNNRLNAFESRMSTLEDRRLCASHDNRLTVLEGVAKSVEKHHSTVYHVERSDIDWIKKSLEEIKVEVGKAASEVAPSTQIERLITRFEQLLNDKEKGKI